MRIAILGGGLTGLTLGYLLKQSDTKFEILEGENDCGGLMKTSLESDFVFDYGGSHVIFSKDERLLSFMLAILGDNKVKRRRNTKILYKGNYVKYPFENGLGDLPREETYECLHGFVQSCLRKIKQPSYGPTNFKEWCYHSFGAGIAKKYLIPYNEKIWKQPTDKISVDWVERLPEAPLEDIIKSALGIDTEGYKHQLFFYYPKTGGIHALITSLERRLDTNIIRNFFVVKIRKSGDGWLVSNGLQERFYDKIISTIPLPDLVQALQVKGVIRAAAKALKFNSLITVLLGLRVPKISKLSWLYVPTASTLAHRISFPSNYSPYAAPEGHSSILAEITCNFKDEIWMMRDAAIIERVSRELQEAKLLNCKDICFSKIHRSKYAYVIYDLSRHSNVNAIRDYMKRIGIDLVGRFAEFQYLNMDECIKSAIEYVDKFNGCR